MENIHKVWIMSVIILSLNFLTAKRPWNIKNVVLNQSICFKIMWTLKFK